MKNYDQEIEMVRILLELLELAKIFELFYILERKRVVRQFKPTR